VANKNKLWMLMRDYCPPLYQPILDAMMQLPEGVSYVPNMFGVIRQTVPTATDAQIDAAGHWWNRLQFEFIPDADQDPRIRDIRHHAYAAMMVLAEREPKIDLVDFVRFALRNKFPDLTEREFRAAMCWVLEIVNLSPEEAINRLVEGDET
jgi:hypothetical protein